MPARRLLPAGTLVGVSTHAADEVRAAAADGADFAFFGPVHATPAKAGFGPPQGVSRLAEATRAAPLPVLAIGGVGADEALALRAAGAYGVAVIRAILGAADAGAATRALLEALG
jgi:thiamine-phosphate pyrophosphorylase